MIAVHNECKAPVPPELEKCFEEWKRRNRHLSATIEKAFAKADWKLLSDSLRKLNGVSNALEVLVNIKDVKMHTLELSFYLTSQIKFLHKVIEIDSREIALAHDAIDALKQEINRMDEARERLLEKMGGVDL